MINSLCRCLHSVFTCSLQTCQWNFTIFRFLEKDNELQRINRNQWDFRLSELIKIRTNLGKTDKTFCYGVMRLGKTYRFTFNAPCGNHSAALAIFENGLYLKHPSYNVILEACLILYLWCRGFIFLKLKTNLK